MYNIIQVGTYNVSFYSKCYNKLLKMFEQLDYIILLFISYIC